MDLTQDLEQLRNIIRAAVVEVLKQRSASAAVGALPGDKQLVLLFTSGQAPSPEFLSGVSALAKLGFRFSAGFSHTFAQLQDVNALLAKLPPVGNLPLGDEAAIAGAVRHSLAVVAPCVSENTAAKLSLGIQDSGPSILLAQAIAAGKPVFVACDLPAHRDAFSQRNPGASPVRERIHADHLHALQQMGVQFVPSNLAEAVQAQFTPQVNETPERLAKQRPTPKRQFITAEDVWEAISRGQKELVHPRTAVVTDQAREYADARNFILKPD